MFHVKLMKNQMPALIGQIHGDFKVTAWNFGQVYVSVTKPTCPALSAVLNTGVIRSLKVTGKAFMLCSYSININVMCSTTWPI